MKAHTIQPPQTGIHTQDPVESQLPSLYNIILHNDLSTDPYFVVDVLKTVFGHDASHAQQIMLRAHTTGAAVVETTTLEMAECRLQDVRHWVQSSPPGSNQRHPNQPCELAFAMEPQ